MIARIWRGARPHRDATEYLEYVRETGCADRSLSGEIARTGTSAVATVVWASALSRSNEPEQMRRLGFTRSLRGQRGIPQISRRRSRQSSRWRPPIPVRRAKDAPLFPGNPRLSRLTRKSHHRPVTLEVAGSSPVAPVP